MRQHDLPLSSKVFKDIFEYVPEKKFIYLYNAGRKERYDEGEFLLEQGGNDETVFLILEGEFRVYKKVGDWEVTVSVLKPGDWIGEVALEKGVTRISSAVATKPSQVLALDGEVFDTLDKETQLSLMRKFNTLAAERLDFLINQQKELMEQQDRLLSIIKSSLNTENYIYSESELIQSFIKVIPTLPVYAVKLITMLNDSSVSMEEISKIIRQDPTLAAQVLRVANSPYYGFQNKIRDIQHALALLGLNQVYLLVTFYAIRSTMPKSSEFSALQVHSVVMSYVGAELAANIHKESEAMIGTLGLLHDIGRSLVLLLKQKHPESALLFDTFDHNILGSLLLKSWNLPDDLCDSIRYQGYFDFASPDDIPEPYRMNVALLSISHMVVDQLSGKQSPEKPFLREYKRLLGIVGYSVQEIAELKVMPGMKRKWKSLPVIVRNYLAQKQSN
ncbi:MAG: HDOD domain-containing protein [Desulfovibrionales bacterium]